MALNAAEYRIRRHGTEWRDNPVICVVRLVTCTDPIMCRKIMDGAGRVLSGLNGETEVRWNYTGLDHGHYVSAKDDIRESDRDDPE